MARSRIDEYGPPHRLTRIAMKSFGRVLRLLAVLPPMLAPWCAEAMNLPQSGTLVSNPLVLFGKPVPLPPGDWWVVSSGFGQATGSSPGPYGAFGGVLLVPEIPDENRMFLLVHTNALPISGGWGTSSVCNDETNLYAASEEPVDLHEACTFVAARRGPRRIAGDLPAFAQQNAFTALPPWALIAGFRVADRRDVVEVRLGIAPPYPDPAAWFSGGHTQDGPYRNTVERLAAWAQEGRLRAQVAMRSPPTQSGALSSPRLDGMTSPLQIAADSWFPLTRNALKFATGRALTATATFALATTLSGNAATGAWITFWQMLTGGAIFAANELAWDWPGPRPTHDLVRTAPEPPGAIASFTAGGSRAKPTAQPVVALAGKQVPLPAGHWTVLARTEETGVSSLVLGLIEDGVLRALLFARTNTAPMQRMPAAPADCARTDLFFTVIRIDTARDGYCAWGKLVIPGDQAADDPAWRMTLDHLHVARVARPAAFMMTGAQARTQENFLDLRYYFATEARMVMSRQRAGEDAYVQARLDGLRAWADLLEEPAAYGLRGRLPTDMARLPQPWPNEDVEAALQRQTHQPLERLRSSGAIDDLTYKRQTAQADALAREREQQRWSLWTKSMYKTTTYRVASYLDTVAVAWVVTGEFGQSLSLANWTGLVKPLLIYLNDVAWTFVGRQPQDVPEIRTTFPEIGLDRH